MISTSEEREGERWERGEMDCVLDVELEASVSGGSSIDSEEVRTLL